MDAYEEIKKMGMVTADYKGFKIDVPKFDVNYAIGRFNKMDDGARRGIAPEIEKDIDRMLPQLQAATLSAEETLLCLQDIAIWHANEIIEGRVKL